MSGAGVPTPYAWLGGAPALEKLFAVFYARVGDEPILAPLFASMPPEHVPLVAAFVGEVLGGPKVYSETRGGHPAMVARHGGRAITEAQRKRWMALLLECADEIGMPGDPEFRSTFVAYLEWGSRLAVINSAPDAVVGDPGPMPRWGWGEARGPYPPSK